LIPWLGNKIFKRIIYVRDIPAEDYIEIVIPSFIKLATKVKDACPDSRIIMFPKGQTNARVI